MPPVFGCIIRSFNEKAVLEKAAPYETDCIHRARLFLCGGFGAISVLGAGLTVFQRFFIWRCTMKRRKVFELLTLCAVFMAVSPMGVLAGDMRLTGQGKEVT